MQLREYLHLVRRSWLFLTAMILLGLSAGALFTIVQTPHYVATAKAFVSTGAAISLSDLSQGNSFTQQAVKSYAEVAESAYVLDPVIKELGLHESAAQLASRVTADAPLDTVVLEISASDPSPRRAADIANAVTARLSSAVLRLTPPTENASAAVKITQLQSALPPASPSSPNLILDLLVGLLLGAAIGVLAAVTRQYLDTRVRTAAEATAVARKPTLGVLPFDPISKDRPLAVVDRPNTSTAEAFRTLRTNLQFLNLEFGHRTVVITSSVEGEGKSTSAANLAITLGEAGQKVLVIDADLRRPRIAQYLGLPGDVGLTDVLIQNVRLQDAIQTWGDAAIRVLPAGTVPPNPSELLQSTAMEVVLQQVGEEFDVVIIDTPPLLPVTDAAILARRSGGALIVCATGRVRRAELDSAVGVLSQLDARILGLVVTMVRRDRHEAYAYSPYAYTDQATPGEAGSGTKEAASTTAPIPTPSS